MGYNRNPQTIPDDTPGGSTTRQAVKDQNSEAIDNLFSNLNIHSNNEDGLSHVQIDAKLQEIEENYLGEMQKLVDEAEGYKDDSEESAAESATSELNSFDSSVDSANCKQEAYGQAVIATEAAGRAETAADRIPEPQPGDSGKIIEVNQSENGYNIVDPSRFVGTNGDQTINDTKTFTSSPIVPTPTTDFQVATKKYADDLNIWGANDARAKTALNASGSAPIYACRAWVNFNGVGVIAIRGSGNISSVTDGGTGTYNINFITSMEDINYSILGICSTSGSARGVGGWLVEDGSTRATNTTLVRCYDMGATGSSYTLTDSNFISIGVNR